MKYRTQTILRNWSEVLKIDKAVKYVALISSDRVGEILSGLVFVLLLSFPFVPQVAAFFPGSPKPYVPWLLLEVWVATAFFVILRAVFKRFRRRLSAAAYWRIMIAGAISGGIAIAAIPVAEKTANHYLGEYDAKYHDVLMEAQLAVTDAKLRKCSTELAEMRALVGAPRGNEPLRTMRYRQADGAPNLSGN